MDQRSTSGAGADTLDHILGESVGHWDTLIKEQKAQILSREIRRIVRDAPPRYGARVAGFLESGDDDMQIGDAGELHVFGNMELRDDVAKFIADEIDEFYDLLLPEALILALARTSVEFSVASVETLVNAYPDCVETAIRSLIDVSGIEAEQENVKTYLLLICRMFPWTAHMIRYQLTESEVFPNLSLDITSMCLKDEIEYIVGVFANHPKYLKSIYPHKNETFLSIREDNLRFLILCRTNVLGINESALCARLKLYCGMLGILGVALSDNELDAIESSLLLLPQSSRAHKLCLALALMARGVQSRKCSKELLQAISARDPESQLSEALLMLRVFFRANCQSQAELLLRQLIGLDITLSPKMILQIRFLFSKDSCKDYYLASQALGIKKVGLIYSAVVLQLLNAKIIQSSGLDVSPWIQYNITSDPLSLDATFLKIVEMYVKSLAEIKTFSPLPFELLEGLKTIPETPLDVGKNLSVMYYFLLYNSQLRDPRVSQFMEPLNFHCDQSIITNLLHLAENMKSCPLLDAIFPHLTGLMMSQYPELFDPMAFHHRESFFETQRTFSALALRSIILKTVVPSGHHADMDLIKDTISKHPADLTVIRQVLDYLLHLNPFQGLTHGQQIVDYVLPLLIERKGSPAVPLQLKSSFIRLWTSLYSISPRKMCLLFFDRALKLLRLKDPHIYTHKVLQARPVLIFRIFEILVECPELTDVFLYIVRYYMIESSNYVYHLHANKLTSGETDKLNIETITDLQGAVIVQALLELCSVIPGQAQKICLFIHQIFIERSLLIKLVINQGFPIQLIPMSVDFIPSIHVAIDFIPELLARSNERQKLFLLNLAAHLFKKYPIEKSLSMARDIIIPQARSLLQPLLDYNAKLQEPESFRRNVLLLPPTLKDVLIAINVFPILPTIAKAFPALLLNIVLLIQEFNPKTSLAPSSSTPGPPSLGEEHSPFSRQYHLEELQTEVNNTFRSLCDSVYSASAEELDKSIVHSNSDLNDLRAYKFFYYGQ